MRRTAAILWSGLAAQAIVLPGYSQDPMTLPGKNYTVAFENSEVAVIRAHYGPHEKVPVHDHPSLSTIFVYLTDSGPVRINHEEQGSTEPPVTRPPTTKGAYRVAPGIAERHSIENLGDVSSEFLRVELKHVSLEIKEPFRGKAPQSFDASEDVVEFPAAKAQEGSPIQIERIVCVGAEACEVKASMMPSLLVAFTGFTLLSDKPSDRPAERDKLDAGSVRWFRASERMYVKAEDGGVAHLLRIGIRE